MTFNDYQFPPGTALYPPAAAVQQYLLDFAKDFNLRPYIRFQSRVEEAYWRDGAWDIRVAGQSQVERFDHLVVANGHYNKPYEPDLLGLREWKEVEGRDVTHSTWYKEPSAYAGKRVVVIGGGPSGNDISAEMAQVAAETYHSVKGFVRDDTTCPKQRPPPERFEAEGNGKFIYSDGSVDEGIDAVILATGYEYNVPFLSQVVTQRQLPTPEEFPPHLWNSGAHIYPLARHIFPISHDLPPSSLAFLGLPHHVVPFPLCEAQALAALRVFTHPETLEIEQEKDWVRARNDSLKQVARKVGGDELRTVCRLWHRISGEPQFEYRDALLRFAGVTKWLTDDWLPEMYAKKAILREEWSDAVRSGEGEAIVKDAKTKEDWYGVLLALLARRERRRGENAKDPVKPAGLRAKI
ncbi:hypothetical protein FRC04_009535 [Tulasnella sp. 424]|nr:hypothetical protein FRC04_009535 [Tulasnella sp. 424]KAG8974281.1 hypothetical protein FRC05_007705 [Tulasnella sp. 425]